ncbi:hypothetical protein GCM10022223_59030 [Kineosporia mesophila]|uniref:Uncharacterized protein n=1 Tax=Kineosporia mesophila TaxID=566012 RepID=A0ABP7AHP8_9ACTN
MVRGWSRLVPASAQGWTDDAALITWTAPRGMTLLEGWVSLADAFRGAAARAHLLAAGIPAERLEAAQETARCSQCAYAEWLRAEETALSQPPHREGKTG